MYKEGVSARVTTSGATIVTMPHHVLKTGPAGPVGGRIEEQGRWLQEHRSFLFPHVSWVGPNSYIMDRLDVLDTHDMSPESMVRMIVEILRKAVWEKPIEQRRLGVDEMLHHWGYIAAKAQALGDEFFDTIAVWVNRVRWVELPTTPIHGDPTFDNCMRRGSRVVLIDPIPASDWIPSTRAVDVGKILQSVCGYEAIKYGREPCKMSIRQVLDLVQLSAAEEIAAMYFLLVHIIRLIPYQPDDLKPLFTVMFKNCLEEIDQCT